LWVQVMATIGIALPILHLGLSYAMSRFFPSKEDLKIISKDFSSIFLLFLVFTGSISSLIYFYPSPLANAIFEGNTLIVKLVAVILFVWCTDRFLMSVFRAFREMKKYAIIQIVTKYSEISLAALLVLLGYGIIGAVVALLIVRGGLFVVLSFVISKKIGFSVPNLSNAKEYLKFGVPLIPSQLSAWVVNTSDRYIIGFFLGATFVGYYSPGYTVGRAVPKMIGSIFLFVLTPTLSEYYEKNDMSRIYTISNYCLKYLLVISSLYIIGAVFFGREVLEILTDPVIAENGYIIIVLTTITGLFYGIYAIYSRFIILKENSKVMGALWISASILNFGGNIYLVPRIGILGAAITTIISYLFVLVGSLYFASKYFELRIDTSYFPKLIICSILTIVIIIGLTRYLIITNFYIDIILSSGFYLLFAWILGIIKKEEINFLKSIASRS